MTFTTKNLVDNRVLVSGTDQFGIDGSTVLNGTQWAEINEHTQFDAATEEFAAAVEAFFAPLTEATEKFEEARKRTEDGLSYVVLHEGVAATPGQPEQLVKLSKDSMVLRLLEQGDSDRLVWVDGGLEILEVAVPVVAPSAGKRKKK
jgi:hypothetical protein